MLLVNLVTLAALTALALFLQSTQSSKLTIGRANTLEILVWWGFAQFLFMAWATFAFCRHSPAVDFREESKDTVKSKEEDLRVILQICANLGKPL